MPSTITTVSWWHAAGARAAYTALAAVIPLAALLVAGEVTAAYVLSIVALAALASLATSLVSLPEVGTGAGVPLWRAILTRAARTAGQVAAPVLGAVALIEEIDWTDLGVVIGGAVLVTVLRTLKAYLPEEAAEPTDQGTGRRRAEATE